MKLEIEKPITYVVWMINDRYWNIEEVYQITTSIQLPTIKLLNNLWKINNITLNSKPKEKHITYGLVLDYYILFYWCNFMVLFTKHNNWKMGPNYGLVLSFSNLMNFEIIVLYGRQQVDVGGGSTFNIKMPNFFLCSSAFLFGWVLGIIR